MEKIERPTYLEHLISARGDGNIKVISGLRRCGKSYLLKHIFMDWLIADGIPTSHILLYDLEDRRNKHLLDPDVLLDTIESRITDDSTYFILIDEVQKMKDFTEVLASLLLMENAEIYVTGSNSKFLSKDIVTEFRGRATEVHVYPLSFAEFLTAYDGQESESFLQYIYYGGLPQILTQATHAQKAAFLNRIYKTVYLKDIYERYKIEYPDEFEELAKVLASAIGTPTNPLNLSHSFQSKKHLNGITDKTVSSYISYIEDAFLMEKAERYDIKGKAYIDSPFKYYFQDLGVRNALLSFRQVEETHLMENAIYNELRVRGYSVDVGQVPVRILDEAGKQVRRTYEVDFVANKGSQRYYIQSAWKMPDKEKEDQESRPFRSIGDSFKKIIVTGDNVLLKRDESGIVTIPVAQFLKDPNSLEL
jgi:predicted AAA+ superfamily ATPase